MGRIFVKYVNQKLRSDEMLVVGLTGGIASGKSQATAFFRQKNVPVLDADEIVRDLQAPGSELVQEIAAAFGPHMLTREGALDRGALGQLIFTNEAAKHELNALIHPRVRQVFETEIATYKAARIPIVVIDVPLLFESQFDDLADVIVVVYVDEATQRNRLMKRDQISNEYAQSKINSQLSLAVKKTQADLVIDNNDTLDVLRQQLASVYETLMQQALKDITS